MRYLLCLLVPLIPGVCRADNPLPQGKTHVNGVGMKFVRIEPGDFVMGQGKAPPRSREEWLERDEDEAPAHRVRLAQPFYLGVHEVTNAQFERFYPEHRKRKGRFGISTGDDDPVAHVTWQQAVDFCRWLGEKEGRAYRLPTEAEWEYACRAGTTTRFHTGDRLTPEQANFGLKTDGKPARGAVKVGSFPPNPWGLHDMHGNVAEWCLDWFGPYSGETQTDPVGRSDGIARVVRGWGWLRPGYQDAARFCRSANRSGFLPGDANRYTGFRVVLGEMPRTRPLPPADAPLNRREVKQTPAPLKGPDPKKPFFVDYAQGKRNPVMPADAWGPIFARHNHFSATCVCPNGDVLAVWYTCSGESDRQLAQAASRLRVGAEKWEPCSLFFAVPDVNCHAPVLLRDGKRIWHFCTQSLHGWDYASNIARYSDDSGATWSPPEIILHRDAPNALSQPCTALVTRKGTMVLACDGDNHRNEHLMLSTDRGKTWTVAPGDMRKAAGGRYVIHPAIIERKDGAILSFLRGPNPMPMLISSDLGTSWEVRNSPFTGISSGQKACALRLQSGAMALLTIDRKLFGGGTILALSDDEGKTWPHVRRLPAPGGYMSIDQAPDGTLYLIGSRMRFAACNEAWVRDGK